MSQRLPPRTDVSFEITPAGAVVCAIALLLGASANVGAGRSASGIDHSARMRGYVESSRVTDFCPDQQQRRADERCIVTRGWDYDRGVTIVRTFNPDGKLIDTVEPAGADLSLTAVEKARVEALVRADPRTRDIVNQPGIVFWTGGFVMREPGDRWCDRGSRCIRAIAASDDGNNAVLHSVVDLMRDRVVYPGYGPESGKQASADRGH